MPNPDSASGRRLPRLLDIAGVAEHLAVSERHVRRLVAEPLRQVGTSAALRPRRDRRMARRRSTAPCLTTTRPCPRPVRCAQPPRPAWAEGQLFRDIRSEET